MAAPKLAQGDVAGAAKDVAAESAIGGVVGPFAGELIPMAGRAVQGVRELLRSGDNRIGRAFTATMRPMSMRSIPISCRRSSIWRTSTTHATS